MALLVVGTNKEENVMMDQFAAVLVVWTVAAGVGAFRWLVGDPGPKHPLARGARDIFTALEGKPLPTPGNALVWWRRKRATNVIRRGQAK